MCDTMVQVSKRGVRFAKNSDRDPNEAQLLQWLPAAIHGGGELKTTYLTIPQVRQTQAVLLSRPYWLWGAEMGANAAGVVIGNEAVFTRSAVPMLGLTGMDLVRLALERAETAKEAVEVILLLIERHGQGGGCGHEDRAFRYHNSFLIADAGGAFVLETAGAGPRSGDWYAIEEVVAADEPVGRSISNGLTIEPFARTHRRWLHTKVAGAAERRAQTEPCARRAADVGDLFAVLRSHGEGERGPRYSIVNGGLSAPCVHGSGLVAASQTTGSWVSELTSSGARHWATATAAPCTSLFKPVAVDEPVDLGAEPTDRYDAGALWWRHERLHRAVMTDPERLLPPLSAERDAIERAWLADPPSSAAAFAEAERWLARQMAAISACEVRDVRPLWVRRYQRARDRRAGIPER